MSKVLTHSTKSYIKIFFVGILVGCICRLADYFPADTLWSFSSIQTLLGFWIITNTTIVLLSTSNICAGISSFLYMFGMTLSFYGLQAILGMNCTPFVRQYDILNNKWGVLLCQKEYQTNAIHQKSRSR